MPKLRLSTRDSLNTTDAASGCQPKRRTRLDSRGNVSALVLEDGEELACDFHHCGGRRTPGNPFSGALQRGDGQGRHRWTSISLPLFPVSTGPGMCAACPASGPNAMKQGAVAAKNMYGIPTPYEDTYAMKNTMNFFGLPALCIGDINRLDSHTLVITEEDSQKLQKGPGGGRRTEKHTDGGKYIRQRYLPVSDKKPDKTTVCRPEHLQAVICRLLWI